MTRYTLANYEEEKKHFNAFVVNDDEPNILLFKGQSGSGKTAFIEHCLNRIPDTPSIFLNLQAGADTLPTLFTRLGATLKWESLPNFTRTVAQLLEQPDKTADPIWQQGMHRHIQNIGKISDFESRLSRYQTLSDAWFADAQQFDKPILIALDSYENRSTIFNRWFSEDFLVKVATSEKVRVLIGGQSVPTLNDNWSFCASLYELKGIDKAEDWLKWAGEAGYQVPTLEYLAGIVAALEGNPGRIREFIETQFPQSNGHVKPKESLLNQRKLIFDNIVSSFSLEEIKNICYFMEIDYEILPPNSGKGGFVRELLAYAQRIGRHHELIQYFQQERQHLTW